MSSRPSFTKRQKEQARREKQRLKAERKQQRKLERGAGLTEVESASGAVQKEDGQDA
jgi:hypothetical protein